MGKKHFWRKSQVRRRLKPTTGKIEFTNVVYMEKEDVDGRKQVYGTCTCGWRTTSEASTIQKVGMEAKAHVEASEGKCKLRQHVLDEPTTPDPLSEEAVSP